MERMASGLAARLVAIALVALVIYWLLPGAGPSELKRMNLALQNARSWRVQTVVTEPTKSVESLTEVYCPSRVRTVNKSVSDEGGRHNEEDSEDIWIDGTSYARKGYKWVVSQQTKSHTASCAVGPRATDALLQPLDLILTTGKIRKGEKRTVNEERCQDWTASVPAPAGWREEFVVCIAEDGLPREVFTPDRRLVETYSDWNASIRIEPPPAEEVR